MRRRTAKAVDGLEYLLRVLLEFRGNGKALSAVAVAILAYLGQQPERAATVGDIQRRLGISQQRTSLLCQTLARSGYVRKRRTDTDGRVVRIHLTEKGFKAIDK